MTLRSTFEHNYASKVIGSGSFAVTKIKRQNKIVYNQFQQTDVRNARQQMLSIRHKDENVAILTRRLRSILYFYLITPFSTKRGFTFN